MRLVPIEDYPDEMDWYLGLRFETDSTDRDWVFCDGCSNGLELNRYNPDKMTVNTWKRLHYYCAKEYIEVDDTLLNWMENDE